MEELKKRILILDGAIGTTIKKYRENQNIENDILNEELNLLYPDIVKEIHRSYIKAGADIIETNTFNSNDMSAKKYKIENNSSYKISLTGVLLAKEVAGEIKNKKIYIAGSIGPTSTSLFLEKNKESFEKVKVEFIESIKGQIEGVIDGKPDFLFLETVYDSINLEVMINTIKNIFKQKQVSIPIIISLTLGENGKIFSGETFEEIIKKVDNELIIGYGINCSYGSQNLVNLIEEIERINKKLMIIYPNAGLPDKNGVYKETPEIFVNYMKKIMDNQKVNIVGGCCGTTYEYIKKLSDCSKNYLPKDFELR